MNDVEKKFLLTVEKGDTEALVKLLQSPHSNLDINCCDPLSRNALVIAIDNEDLETMKVLIEAGINLGDALLHAIDEDFVEAVELLVDCELATNEPGKPHSWELDRDNSFFSADMTPLILAAHRNNSEIIKILLDRDISSVPDPHDPRCDCVDCCVNRAKDCLKYSRSRINAYKALASPCLMALSSPDPLLAAFEMSAKLENLANLEPEYKGDYLRFRSQCQAFATQLLDQARTSEELKVLLDYNDSGHLRLARLRLAIQCKQKTFCAHPNIQELLASMWYENLPGFRQKKTIAQTIQVISIGVMFPVYSIAYLIAPDSRLGRYIKRPFIKFICHSASYISFLFTLILASQRFDALYNWDSVLNLFSKDNADILNSRANFTLLKQVRPPMTDFDDSDLNTLAALYEHLGSGSSARSLDSLSKIFEQPPASSKKRGVIPSPIELVILVYILSLIWAEIKQLKALGMNYYREDMWNTLDSVASGFYIGAIILHIWSCVGTDERSGDVAREHWHAYDPILLSEGLFAAGTIFSALKLVYIFSVNPYLGPLQISLGRMTLDILRFSWIYLLVLFSFACGMNQLLWYYADLERHQCLNITNYNLAQYYSAQQNASNQFLDSDHLDLKTPSILPVLYKDRAQNVTYISTTSSTTLPPLLNNGQNISDESLMEAALNASLEDDSSKPPITIDDSCKTWRHFANVFESSQTLFWATFGLVDLENFELTGIRQYTRFWALLMFGCYCFINVIVVLNLLIAMMNHSYVKISKKSDIEWKFARTRLWMSYFDTGSTVPAPFNIIPSIKSIVNLANQATSLVLQMFRWSFSKLTQLIGSIVFNSNIHQAKSVNCYSPSSVESRSRRPQLLPLTCSNNIHVKHKANDIFNCAKFQGNQTSCYKKVMKSLVRRYLVREKRLLEKKRDLTEAKLNRWTKWSAFE